MLYDISPLLIAKQELFHYFVVEIQALGISHLNHSISNHTISQPNALPKLPSFNRSKIKTLSYYSGIIPNGHTSPGTPIISHWRILTCPTPPSPPPPPPLLLLSLHRDFASILSDLQLWLGCLLPVPPADEIDRREA